MTRDKSNKRNDDTLKSERQQHENEAKAQKDDMRETPEDKGKTARRTTPAGKGRSQ